MANSPAICTSFKKELLQAYHALGTPPAHTVSTKDTFYAALFLASASLGAATTDFTGTQGSVAATGEVTGTGYTAGGVQVTNGTEPNTSGTTAFWTPSASLVYTTVTLTTAFDAVLIYNVTQGERAVAVYTFGSQTITAGTFTLTMPTNDASTGLLRLA